jgi:FMN phosphatase YigB (HAD superfamily)
MSAIKAVTFDMDGTLVHLPGRLPEEWLFHVYRRMGLRLKEERVRHAYRAAEEIWRRTVRPQLGVTRASFVAWNRLILEHLKVLDDLDELAQQVQSAWESQEDLLFPEVPQVLHALKERGFRLGIVTHRFPEAITGSLKRHALAGYFECLIHPKDGQTDHGKHDPKLWRQVIQTLNLLPERILHVGDDYEADLLDPQAQDLNALLIDRYGRFPEVLADRRIRDLRELLNLELLR